MEQCFLGFQISSGGVVRAVNAIVYHRQEGSVSSPRDEEAL